MKTEKVVITVKDQLDAGTIHTYCKLLSIKADYLEKKTSDKTVYEFTLDVENAQQVFDLGLAVGECLALKS